MNFPQKSPEGTEFVTRTGISPADLICIGVLMHDRTVSCPEKSESEQAASEDSTLLCLPSSNLTLQYSMN